MFNLFLIVAGVLGIWGAGVSLAHVLLRSISTEGGSTEGGSTGKVSTGETRAEVFGLGLVLGFGMTAIFYFLWGLIGLPFSSPLAYFWTVTGWLAGSRTVYAHYRPLFTKKEGEESETTRINQFCWGILFLLVATTMLETIMTPQRFWDERAIFGLKALVIFQDRTIQSESLHDPYFVQYHPKYPLLIPLNEAHLYFLLGEVNDRWSKVMPPLLYFGMILTFYGVLIRTGVPSFLASIFTLMLATVPAMVPWEYGFISAQADAPVACFHLVAVLYLWNFLTTWDKAHRGGALATARTGTILVIAGLATGLAAFTKDEGIALFLVDLIALLIVTGLSFRDRLLSTGTAIFRFVFVTAMILLPWFYYRTTLPSTMEMTYFSRLRLSTLAQSGTSLQWAVRHLVQRMFLEASQWGLQWWGVVISFLAFPFRAFKPQQLFLLLDILGAISALILAGLIAPTPIEEHIGGSSHRFLIQISGTALLFIAGQWTRQLDGKSADARSIQERAE